MLLIKEISDLSAPELDVYARLTEARLRSERLFVAESAPVIESAISAGFTPVSMLMERRHLNGKANDLARQCGVPVYTSDDSVLEQLTGYRLTRGVLCAFKRRELPDAEQICFQAEKLVILEGITDSTNVGAIFRSVAALGADAVLLTSRCCDPLCRRALRVSMGTVFKLPWTFLPEESWPRALTDLRQKGFFTIATALSHTAVDLDDPRLAGKKRTAVVLGSEGSGLTVETIRMCDSTVKIPMSSGVDSLNVAAASAVIFWQLFRNK